MRIYEMIWTSVSKIYPDLRICKYALSCVYTAVETHSLVSLLNKKMKNIFTHKPSRL